MKQGRKTHTFEYPNKKYRFVEDLGENLRTFDIEAIITGDDDYLIRREALVLVLQMEGKGILTHPFYGMVPVTVKDYTVSENLTSLGECSFKITFEESQLDIFPVSAEGSLGTIASIANEIAPYAAGFLATGLSNSFKHNIVDTGKKCDALNNSLQPTKPVVLADNAWNDFSVKSKDFRENKYLLLQNNVNFEVAVSDLLDSYNNLGQTANASYLLNASAYYFGSNDIPVKQTTAERVERVTNRKVYNSYVNTKLLMAMYLNAVEMEYLDDQQIEQKQIDLEEKYQYLMKNNVLTADVLRRLEVLRNSVKKYFNDLNVNVSKVININTPKIPLSVLLYQYYAGFDNEDEIIALNNIIDVTQISGDIKILTGDAQ
jgi:hypothetical protein